MKSQNDLVLRGRLQVVVLFVITTIFCCRTALHRSGPDDYTHLSSVAPPLLLHQQLWNGTLARMASAENADPDGTAEVEAFLSEDGDASTLRQFDNRSGIDSKKLLLIRSRAAKYIQMLPSFRLAFLDWSRNRNSWASPGIMSELPSLVKARFSSCAVVGNSGILLQHEHGKLIDRHDLVIRLNLARTSGFEAHVGSKTGLAFVNSNIVFLCGRRRGCPCNPYGADVPMMMYVCQAVHFLDYVTCGAYRSAPLLVTDARLDALCAKVVKYYSLKRFTEETGKAPEEWGTAHDVGMFHYSSGMEAVMLAVGVCDRVSIFGFGKVPGAKHHYHTKQERELDLHDYEAEYEFYRDLVSLPQAIPFLADQSGFKIPPVIMYR